MEGLPTYEMYGLRVYAWTGAGGRKGWNVKWANRLRNTQRTMFTLLADQLKCEDSAGNETACNATTYR